MKVYFNNVGVITSTDFTGDSLRQGSVGVTLKAYFSGINNANYTALLNFTRSNGTSVSGIRMELDASNSECYNYKFDDPWFFAKAGTTTLTIFLHDAGGNVIAQGQVQFSIEATDYDDDPDITVSQYNELITMIEEVESSGEMNVLEGVQVNGVDLPIDANKKVNVDISGKVDKVTGKGLSTNDFTNAYKNKLDGIEANADANVIDGIKVKDATTTTLTPDANKDVTIDISGKANKASDSVDGNLASLDENGNLEDSGYAASDIGDLDQRVDNLENIGKFLSIWDAENGVALTNPPTSPYTYHTGDYFRVGTAGNKVPTGTQYVTGGTNYTTGASLNIGDVVYFDGTQWIPQSSGTAGNVISVAGKTGVVTLNKGDVGLGNVLNTGDSSVPVSGGTTKFTTGGAYTELNKKVDKPSSSYENNLVIFNSSHGIKDSSLGIEMVSVNNVAVVQDVTHNLNGTVVPINNLHTENYSSGNYTGLKLLKNTSDILTKNDAKAYMYCMCGSKYVPEYNQNVCKNSFILLPDGTLYKPQYDNTNGLLLFKMNRILLNPMTTTGDIVVNGSNGPQRLGIGSQKEFLYVGSSGVRWNALTRHNINIDFNNGTVNGQIYFSMITSEPYWGAEMHSINDFMDYATSLNTSSAIERQCSGFGVKNGSLYTILSWSVFYDQADDLHIQITGVDASGQAVIFDDYGSFTKIVSFRDRTELV